MEPNNEGSVIGCHFLLILYIVSVRNDTLFMGGHLYVWGYERAIEEFRNEWGFVPFKTTEYALYTDEENFT